MPTIDDFIKFEFKVAKIVEVEDHPNADRLYVIKIDTGMTAEQNIAPANDDANGPVEARLIAPVQPPSPILKQIVAGIKKSYKKEDLIGKYVVVVDNLEPAVLRGVESNGMLLAASDDEGICIVSPERAVKLGSRVK